VTPSSGLELADRGAERRLGDVDRLGGARESPALDDLHEVGQLSQVHLASIAVRDGSDTNDVLARWRSSRLGSA
jgi:hypothetical protein